MEKHIISEKATLFEALDRLNHLSGGVMTLFALTDSGTVSGSLTDGDIRRALLRGVSLQSSVAEAMNRDFHRYDAGDHGQIPALRQMNVSLLPVLDYDGKLMELIDLTKIRARLPLKAILMAGGLGERLRPMTLTTPKPLLEIEGKPIIDYNIEKLAAVGITDIYVTARYLSEKIASHLSVPVAGVYAKTVVEQKPLGTIGAAALVDIPPEGNTLVMNSDILTTLRFEEMFARHCQSGADITIAAIPYSVSVPYAILATDGDRVVSLEEKPTYSYFANAGIYIFRNSVLRGIEKNVRTDATTLIEQTIVKGGKVTYFPVNGTWIDIGTPSDFAHAAELMRHHHNFGEL